MFPILLATLLGTPTDPGTSPSKTFHVSTVGKDSNPGTRTSPFATIHRARLAIHDHKKQQGGRLRQPVQVFVRSGTYSLREPLLFTSADSGTKNCPVTFAAAPGAKPVFTGGRILTGWKERIVSGKKLWTVELPEVKAGKWYFHQLWVNGQRRTRARHPNKGFLRIADLPGVTKSTPRYPGQDHFQFAPGDLKAYKNLQDVDVIALHLWVAVRLAVKELDLKGRIVTFHKKSRRRLTDGGELARYYVENALELLDAPGEWYLDRKQGILYYWPAPGEKMASAQIIAPVLPHLVRLEGKPEKGQTIDHLTLRGLTFTHADWWPARSNTSDAQASADVPAVVQGVGLRHCTIEDCTVAHASGYGIHLAGGCQHNRIRRCQVFDLGAGGIRLGEMRVQRQEALQTHDNQVVDCQVHHLGRIFHQAVGLWVGQSFRNRLAHNHIHDLYYTGISCGWTWGYGPTLTRENVIEHNHVHTIGQGLLSDMGGIYTLGRQPGTVIRHNLFHDISASRYGGWGIYFDEGSSQIVAENNLVYRTTHGGFHQHYGKENTVRNNIFALGKYAQVRRSKLEDHRSFTFERNIVYFKEGKLLDGNWNKLNVAFDYNLYWRVGGGDLRFARWSWKQWQAKGMDRHGLIANPLFTNPDKLQFTLKERSPAFKLGFKSLDLSDVGPRSARSR